MLEELKTIYENLEKTLTELQNICINQEHIIIDKRKNATEEEARTLDEVFELTHKATGSLISARTNLYLAKENIQ